MSAVGALVWCRGRGDRRVGRWVMTGRKDPRLGAGTVSSAVHDPVRDHRGDRCPATLATRDGQPSQPVVACLSVHAARLPRRTRSSPWLTALALGGARVVGAAELAAEAAAPRPASSNGSRRVWPDVSAMPRGGPTRAGPRGTSCTGSPRHRPIGPAYPAFGGIAPDVRRSADRRGRAATGRRSSERRSVRPRPRSPRRIGQVRRRSPQFAGSCAGRFEHRTERARMPPRWRGASR
jgi:hypothetical protein